MQSKFLLSFLFAATVVSAQAHNSGATVDCASAIAGPSDLIVPVALDSATSKAAPDSVQAVRKLFHRRRVGAVILAAPGGYIFGAGLAALDENGSASVVLGGSLAAVAISKGARFNVKREEQIIADYQQGKPIPKNIRRRLKRKYFAN
ncbi:MAG TPA: hypothetical protein VF598_13900 [Hymenobacter sp.]